MQNSVKDLLVWQKSMDLVKDVYVIGRGLPSYEDFGLRSQLCRAAVSIPSNIAEGAKRGTKKEFTHFLHIELGSAAEIETQLILTSTLYPKLELGTVLEKLTEIQKMLTGLIRRKTSG